MRTYIKRALISSVILLATTPQSRAAQPDSFSDDFESGLSNWTLSSPDNISIVDSGNENHKKVLELRPAFSPLYALLNDAQETSGQRVEGEFYFPTDGDSYFGVIYNFGELGGRTDFGCIYVKGNGSYIRVNAHLDGNPSRALYEEFKVPMTGKVATRSGVWFPFKAEIIDRECHLYIVDLEKPRITFELFHRESGRIGFEARPIRGEPIWIDNLSVSRIGEFEYTGPPIPDRPVYDRDQLLTSWDILGPFAEPQTSLEKDTDNTPAENWRSFAADPRGALITGKVVNYRKKSKIAYARTTLMNHQAHPIESKLEIATIDRLRLWLNGVFLQSVKPQRLAWHDFLTNPNHAGVSLQIALQPGKNELLIRIDGGKFAGGGFFAALRGP